MENVSRRKALVLSAAGLTSPALADAAPAPDPIFAAIERHRVAFTRHEAACEAMQDRATEEAAKEAGDHRHAALWVLATTVPRTAAGLAALMAYEREHSGTDDLDLFPGRAEDCSEAAAFHFSIEQAVCQLAGLPAPDLPLSLEWEEDAPEGALAS